MTNVAEMKPGPMAPSKPKKWKDKEPVPKGQRERNGEHKIKENKTVSKKPRGVSNEHEMPAAGRVSGIREASQRNSLPKRTLLASIREKRWGVKRCGMWPGGGGEKNAERRVSTAPPENSGQKNGVPAKDMPKAFQSAKECHSAQGKPRCGSRKRGEKKREQTKRITRQKTRAVSCRPEILIGAQSVVGKKSSVVEQKIQRTNTFGNHDANESVGRVLLHDKKISENKNRREPSSIYLPTSRVRAAKIDMRKQMKPMPHVKKSVKEGGFRAAQTRK